MATTDRYMAAIQNDRAGTEELIRIRAYTRNEALRLARRYCGEVAKHEGTLVNTRMIRRVTEGLELESRETAWELSPTVWDWTGWLEALA